MPCWPWGVASVQHFYLQSGKRCYDDDIVWRSYGCQHCNNSVLESYWFNSRVLPFKYSSCKAQNLISSNCNKEVKKLLIEQSIYSLSYSTVVLYIGITSLGILAQNYLPKTSLILLFDSLGVLVRHSQAQEKASDQLKIIASSCYEILKISYSRDVLRLRKYQEQANTKSHYGCINSIIKGRKVSSSMH